MTSARLIAFDILNDVFFQKKSLDEAFARATAFEDLESRDRGFVRLLVATVLKRAPEMDTVLAKMLRDPPQDLKPQQLINVFRLGIAQLAFLETKPHAAVSTTVDLAVDAGITHHKPLVNAVMRRLATEGYPRKDERDAGRANTPEWLWHEWVNDYGVETALDITAALLTESPVDFTARQDADIWAERLEAQLLPTGSLRRENTGFVPDLPGYQDGAWWIQNAAAALPVVLLPKDMTGLTVVDLCAAPGGKTAQLAARGARVMAVDRSSSRMPRLRENLERLHMTAEIVVADGAVWQPKEKADVVLLDAPCTATGTIRHQPDVFYLKDIRDQEKLAALQRRLMTNALEMLKPGGTLIYCTCSLQKAEGEHQTEWFLSQGLPVKISPVLPGEVPGLEEMLTPQGDLRLLPFHWKDAGGIDGFYIARFIKQG
jgi:16S rRNA (cytosine967-C5)-methyltransferase